MKIAKLGTLFLVSILALAGTSAGYALWFDELYIDGTINTGSIGADWSVEGCGDDEEKEYSSITATIVGDTMTVTVTNAYPCINYWVDFNVKNTGTIPIHLYFDWTPPADFPGTITITDLTSTQIHPDETALGTITIHLDNTAPQGDTLTFSATLIYHQYNEPYVPVP